MAKDWAKLGGDRGKPVKTTPLRRAMKLGGLATRLSGSFLKKQVQRIGRDSNEFESLAEAARDNVKQMVDVMGEMKGAAMKIGQLLSTDPDIVDSGFAERLATLQRSAPPMDYVTLLNQFESALDRPIGDVFAYFDPEPIGSASIGQVHRGTLHDGRDVAVKIQYPGIADSIESDMNHLRRMLRLGRVLMSKERADAFVDEARQSIIAEADYEQEAQNLVRFRRLFIDWPSIRIPEPILEYSCPTVLMMEFIDGHPFDEALMGIADESKKDAICTEFIRAYVYMVHEVNVIHADPHPGNFLLDENHRIVLLDFGCIRDLRPELTDDLLRMLTCVWRDDMPTLEQHFRRLKFGKEGMDYPDHEALRAYLHIVLHPMISEEPVNFGDFDLHGPAREFLMDNSALLRMVPPAELLMYFRVLAGLKGMMTRVAATLDVRGLAAACCERRGLI